MTLRKRLGYAWFLLLVTVTSCKLDPVIYPVNTGINIKYQIAVDKPGSYNITYADSLAYDVTELLNNTSWEKTFKVKNKDYFKTAYLKIAPADAASQTTGSAKIYVNGVLKATANFTTNGTQTITAANYTVKK